MAEIKISELSIGDWVNQKMDDGAYQVQWIEREMVGLIKHTGTEEDGSIRLTAVPLSFIEPIPLTPEILEKNGFVKCGRCCTSRTTAYIKDFTFVNHLEERKVWRVKIYGEEGLVELCSILVHHTHQLQNALRLAGVEKEIEL